MYRIIMVVLLLVTVFGSGIAQEEELVTVVATTTQAADILAIVGEELVEVVSLIGPGVDPHLYQPTESDIQAMNSADAVFYNGLFLEGKFETVFEALGERDVIVYAIAEPIVQAGFVLSTGAEDSEASNDPHIWNDPRNWQLVAEGVAEVLGELAPEHTDTFTENAEAYIEDLQALYDWGVAAMEVVPEEQRIIVTSHDAFAYLGDAFDFEVAGIQGISTVDEAGVGDIQEIVDIVVERELPAIFIESSVPTDTVEAVIESANARGWDVQLGVRELFSDAMGDPDEFGGTYIGMMAHNLITILQSYGYEIPEWVDGLEPTLPADMLTMEDVQE